MYFELENSRDSKKLVLRNLVYLNFGKWSDIIHNLLFEVVLEELSKPIHIQITSLILIRGEEWLYPRKPAAQLSPPASINTFKNSSIHVREKISRAY